MRSVFAMDVTPVHSKAKATYFYHHVFALSQYSLTGINPHPQIKDEAAQKPKRAIFSFLDLFFGGGGGGGGEERGYNFPISSV